MEVSPSWKPWHLMQDLADALYADATALAKAYVERGKRSSLKVDFASVTTVK